MYSFVAVCLFFGSARFVAAQTVTFAQYFEINATRDYVFTNNATNATFTTVSGGSPVYFQFNNISGLPTELQGLQFAHVITTATTNQTTVTSSSNIAQPFNGTYQIQILRDTAATFGGGTRRNLLTITIDPSTSSPSLTGSDGGDAATFSATTSPTSPDQVVVFTSDFLSFSGTTQRNMALNFTSVTPSLLNNSTNNFLQTFTAVGGGSAASNPAPVYSIPTAAPASISGRVLNSRGRGIGRVSMELLDTISGEIRQTQTNGDGSYSFGGIPSGQFYILTASRYHFIFEPSSIPVQVNEDMRDLNFNGDQSFWNGR